MPRYQFTCTRCSRDFEVRFSYQELESQRVLCPHCDGAQPRQKLGRVNLGIKGKHALTQEQVGVAMGLVDKIGPHVGQCQDEE